jgi:transcriptional regulator with XRE-family HTH domain
METLASRLKWARAQRGLTPAALAKAACVLTSLVGDLEEGKRDGTRDLSSLAAALGVRPAWLETGQGDWREAVPDSAAPGLSSAPAAGPAPAGALGETIVQLGVLLSSLSPLARTSIAPLIARVAEDPDLAAEAARIADAIARS